MRLIPLLFALSMLAGTALPAAAQWKWRDAKGQLQYSDLPPPRGVPPKDILQTPPTAAGRVERAVVPAPGASKPEAEVEAAAALDAAANAVDPVLEARRKEAADAEADKRKADEARLARTKAENCERARNYLRTLESGVRIARSNAKGEREYLDDRGREQEIQVARGVSASECR